MKKTIKSLRLTRSTIRVLSQQSLVGVDGGRVDPQPKLSTPLTECRCPTADDNGPCTSMPTGRC